MLQQFGKAQAWDMRPGIVNMEHAFCLAGAAFRLRQQTKKAAVLKAQQLFFVLLIQLSQQASDCYEQWCEYY